MLIMVLIRIPGVQGIIGQRVADAVGKKLGTTVSVGRVDLGFLNRIIIDDLTLLDQQQKDMLHVARLSARVELLPLAEGRISISSAQIIGAHASLYKPSADSPANFQFMLDSLASNDTTAQTPLNLRINSLIIRYSSLDYDQYDVAPVNGRFNPAHLHLGDISAYISLKTLTSDSLNIGIKRLSLNEASGISVDNLTLRLVANQQEARLTELQLSMPDTQLTIDSLHATYNLAEDGKSLSSFNYNGIVSNGSYITPSDLRSFVPSLKNYQKPIALSTVFSGNGNSLCVERLSINAPNGDISLEANGSINNWDSRAMSWNATVSQLQLSDQFTDFLSKSIEGTPTLIRRLGSIGLKGTFARRNDGQHNVLCSAITGIGSLTLNGNIDAMKQFNGQIETEGLDLGQLLDDDKLGTLATTITLDGQLNQGGKPTINANGVVEQLYYNNYLFSNITIDGSYSETGIMGHLTIDDPNLDADLEGEFSKPHIRLQGNIARLSPQALHLTDRWDDEQLSAVIDADLTATSAADAYGHVVVSQFTLGDYNLDHLSLSADYDGQQRHVILDSDFAQAKLTGRFDYDGLIQSLTGILASKLPALKASTTDIQFANRQVSDIAIDLTMTKADWLQKLMDIPLELHSPMTLHAIVNDQLQHISLLANLPHFSYDDTEYQTGHISITTPSDTMKASVSVSKINEERRRLDLGVTAEAAANRLTAALRWNNNNHERPMDGVLYTVTQLDRTPDGDLKANVQVTPSQMQVGPSSWTIAPSSINYSKDRLTIDYFNARHEDQHISISGIASKSPHDSLVVDLSKVEVDYVLDLVDFDAVAFGGEASGRAVVTGLFGTPTASGRLSVDHFTFEHGRMGTLDAKVNWNDEAKQIDIDATANDGPDAITYIRGYVSPDNDFIDLDIIAHGTYLDFMHSFTESFISHITGHGNGQLRLAGPLSAINLTGGLIVDGEATVTPLGTTYFLRQDTVSFTYNEISLNRIPIHDVHGNKGYMSGGIHHQDLTNLTFDLSVETDRLLGYDFRDFGEDSFYGTVFASGKVDIEGRPGRVTIDCDVTPLSGTVFTYNVGNPDAISSQEFVQWGKSEQFIVNSEKLRVGNDTSGKELGSAVPIGSVESEGMAADNSSLFALHSSLPTTDIFLNFHINVTPDATMRLLMDPKTGDYITLRGDGALRATYHNKGTLQMFGTYTVNRGTYDITIQNIIKKNFTFQQGGTIVFGGDPYDAALNLQALYTVNGVSLSDLNVGNSFSSNTIRVNCLMNIGGQPDAPQVTFDLEMPTVNADEQQMVRSLLASQQEMNQQVLYLLAIGRFYNQGLNNADQQQDQTSLAMQSFLSGTLSSQINSVLSQVIKNDRWNFGANISTGTEGWNNAEYEGIVNGRMLNNRLLINGQFGYRDNATQATPSFIGDFDIRYLLYPNGNLALKVYNQTNDRYFTKSSLNTQGIGLIMKKDFNGVKELLGGKKKNK